MGAKMPSCWLADLIHSQMATGNFGKMARDAIDRAKSRNDQASVNLYNTMLDQVTDYYSQGGDGTINIRLASK